MATVHKTLLVIDGDGVTLATYNNALVFRSREIKLTAVPVEIRTILMVGYGGSVTLSAMSVAALKHVEVLAWGPRSEIALFAPMIDASRRSLALRLRQFEAVIDLRKTVIIARAIVAAKLKAEDHSPADRKMFEVMLKGARSTNDVRHIEAKAAQLWWRQWDDFKMRFAGRSAPTEWRSWPGRYIGRRQGRLGELAAQFTARNAVHPMQAMLNFSVSILAARMTRVVAAHGLDAAFGFLHDRRKPGRLSLVWDCIELHRPKLVSETFEYAAARVFRKNDFRMIDGGVVRLAPAVMKEVAALAITTVLLKDMIKTVEWMARLIRKV